MTGFTVTEDERIALSVARTLILAGVPVFAAEPCPEGCPIVNPRSKERHRGGAGQYHLPAKWEKTVPAEVWLDRWQPGWALAAVGGHTVDFLDVDPRNGGDVSLKQLQDLGQMPRVFARAQTPSGGTHLTISATGERKYTGFLPGLDLQSGNAAGVGRGFVWIAPTVRASKANQDVGALKPYRWVEYPDDIEIMEWVGTHDPSIEPIIARVTALRATPGVREPFTADPEDPFMTASMSRGVDRSFSMTEAMDFVGPYLVRVQEAQVGEIEERCNIAAAVLSHFVPNFWSTDVAMDLLRANLAHTAYDPQGPSNWTVEKFRAVVDGTRPVQDPWVATRKPDPAAPPTQAIENAPGEQGLTTLEKLRRRLVSAEELMLQPAPEPLVWGLLDMDSEAWMIGEPGSLKSFIALDIAGSVGSGRPWQGHRVRQAKGLVIAAEGARGMVLRTRAYVKVHGGMEGVTFLPYPVQVSSTDGQWDALVELAREMAPGLVVIDTQARVSVGLEENSAKDMGILIDAVGKLRRATGACVLVIHHTGRNGRDARGSSALDGAQDTELKVIRDEPRSDLVCRLKQDKQKDMAEGNMDGIPLRMKIVDLGTDSVTGRPLSSLVVSTDPYEGAQGSDEVDVDVSEWAVVEAEEWTAEVDGINQRSKWQRRILQALADLAHGRGLTEAAARRAVEGKWGLPKNAGEWTNAWNKVTSAPVAVNVGGERWALDRTVVG